jgi:alkylation response protein AidB-like acyl-CoA dehydrogenase
VALAITEDHRALADSARSLVTSRGGLAAARSILLDTDDRGRWWTDDPLWKKIVSTGWLGLHIDEALGGQGFTFAELAIVLEQLGRSAIGGPFLPTVAASAVIAAAGSDEQQRRWLPGLCSGDVVAGIAAKSTATVSDSRVSGDALAALAEPAADVFMLPVGDDVVLVKAGDGVTTRRVDTVDQMMRPVTVVDLASAPVAEVFTGASKFASHILRLLAAAEAIGGLAACTELATSYAAQREQFGRPIGSFQAVKHHCANMLLDTELAVAATWDAARAEGSEAELAATMAAGHALPAYQWVALKNIQIHGGIGYTWEHDAHLFLRRATVLLTFAGDQDELWDRVFELQQEGARRTQSVDLPPEAERYRAQVRAFRAELESAAGDERHRLWARSGYMQPHWPKPYGRSADSVEQLIIEEELSGLERPDRGIGEWVIPTLLQRGNAEQIERLLWPSLEGELRWCQLFSEPGAGSDAAAVSTKATRADGGWVVTGQKVWSSDAMKCQRGLATVRTDPNVRKHKGITAMIVDLTDPGVEIRPLIELTGEALFNEVFLNDVFVPDRDVVGDVNAGWSVAMATLGNERVSIGGGSVTMPAVALLDLTARLGDADSGRAREVGELLCEAYAVSALNLRQAERAVIDAGPGIEGNIVKLTEPSTRSVSPNLRCGSPVRR